MAKKKRTAKKKRSTKKVAKRPRARRVPGKSATPEGGRGEIEFHPDCVGMIGLLAFAGNTLADIAAICEVSKSTLERRAAEVGHPVQVAISEAVALRRSGLRVMQYRTAKGGSAMMQKWLGIQELGQRDHQRIEHTGAEGGPVEVATGDYSDLLIAKIVAAQQSERVVNVELPPGT